MKTCHNCEKLVEDEFIICPYCEAYLGDNEPT